MLPTPPCAWQESAVWHTMPTFKENPYNAWFLLEDPADRKYLRLCVNKKRIYLKNPNPIAFRYNYRYLQLDLLVEACVVAEYAHRLFGHMSDTAFKVHFNAYDKAIGRFVYPSTEEVSPFHKKFFGTPNRKMDVLHEALKLMYWSSLTTVSPGLLYHSDAGDNGLESVHKIVKDKIDTLLYRYSNKMVFRTSL